MKEYLTKEQIDELNRTAPQRRKEYDAQVEKDLARFEESVNARVEVALGHKLEWPKDPDTLIRCAISSLKRKDNRHSRFRGMVLWGMIAEIFCIGSTSAIELCRRFNFDPWEKLK